MELRALSYIAEACGGKLRGKDGEATGVSTDSRTIRGGDVFFAVKGDKFDGHDYVPKLIGAAAVVVERTVPANCPLIEVGNVRAALGKFAGRYRTDFDLPVIAVAGSNGKTTTKEVLGTILQQKFPTVRSEASFNNDIGVPLTLLRLEAHHQAAVLEAGTNHPGELAPLVKLIRPRYGVITNIGREHLEFFGDLEGVAREEGALAELLPADGKLFIGGDDGWSPQLAHRSHAPVVRVGLGEANDWRALNLRTDARGTTFQVAAPVAALSGEYRIHLLGRHQVANALFAIAVGGELGLGRAEIDRGLAECEAPKMRLQLWEHKGVNVLDDAYNANADSMLAALETLRDLPCPGRRVAILGDMAELGEQSGPAHTEVGRYVALWGACVAGIGVALAAAAVIAARLRMPAPALRPAFNP